MKKNLSLTALLLIIALSVPLSLFSQEFRIINGTVLELYLGTATNVTIPDGVTRIGREAFGGKQLTSVTIPNSVTSIESAAFWGNQLTSVTIPNSVTSIGFNAFYNNQLTSVTIGNSVTSIESGAFQDNQLTSVTIPDSVTSIGQRAFENNPLTSITIGNGIGSLKENVFTGSLRNVTRISIGANVNLEGYNDVVWRDFYSFYRVNGNRAGTYTLSNGRWSAVYR